MLGAAAATVVAYAYVVRPWHLRWGATAIEAGRGLPGDDLVAGAATQSTRAVTIEATPAEIWPWLVQIGQGRGGFYSYDWLENLLDLGIHSAERVLSEYQDLRVGDVIRTDPGGGLTVVALEAERLLALRARIDILSGRHLPLEAAVEDRCFDASWVFVVDPLDAECTRLTARFRAGYVSAPANEFFACAILEPAVFIMERQMLLGIKERAERRLPALS